MQIEITGETEKLILSALTSGKYASANEFITVILSRATTDKQPGEKTDAKLSSRRQEINEIPEHIDMDELAATQGVSLVEDFRKLKADFWPEGESVDDFLAGVRAHRKQDSARTR